jgi:hypothetical protein
MESSILDVVSNLGFPIAVSVTLFYQMNKTNETYVKLLRDFQDVISNNTHSIKLLNATVHELKNDLGYRDVDTGERK